MIDIGKIAVTVDVDTESLQKELDKLDVQSLSFPELEVLIKDHLKVRLRNNYPKYKIDLKDAPALLNKRKSNH